MAARLALPNYTQAEWKLIFEEKRFSWLLREIAGPPASDLLQRAIKEAEEQKQHLEKSLETLRSLTRAASS